MWHDLVNRPVTRPGDMVRNKLCWDATSKTKELVPVKPDVPLLTQWEKISLKQKIKRTLPVHWIRCFGEIVVLYLRKISPKEINSRNDNSMSFIFAVEKIIFK